MLSMLLCSLSSALTTVVKTALHQTEASQEGDEISIPVLCAVFKLFCDLFFEWGIRISWGCIVFLCNVDVFCQCGRAFELAESSYEKIKENKEKV